MSLWNSLTEPLSKKPRKKRGTRPHGNRRLRLELLENRRVFSATPLDAGFSEPLVCELEYEDSAAQTVPAEISADLRASQPTPADGVDPVLMVISNQDFWYQDYADTRAALEAQGLEVVVAATTTDVSRPHANSGQGTGDGLVQPDLALTDVNAEDYSAIVFSGGWGMAQYQYGFEGTYHNAAYNGVRDTKQVVNSLVNDFIEQDKHVAAICYGVSVLAYARVDGQSLVQGREVTGWNGVAPSSANSVRSSREQIESNGAEMLTSGSIGDASTSTDDVWIDGKIITAENYDAAWAFGEVIAGEVIRAHQAEPRDSQGTEESRPFPILMAIANQDLYHRE